MAVTLCGNDDVGSASSDCRALDFTVTFEQVVLSILPNALFISLTLLILLRWASRSTRRTKESASTSYFRHLRSQANPVVYKGWDPLGLVKIGVGAGLGIVKLAGAVLIGRAEGLGGLRTSVPAEALSTIAVATLLGFSVSSHRYTVTPSTITCLYALWITLVTGVQIRTYLLVGLKGTDATFFGLICAGVGLSGASCLLEIVSTRRWLKAEYRDIPRRETTSFALKPFFVHLVPLLRLGGRRKLTLDDLEQVPPHLLAAPAMARMDAGLKGGDQSKQSYLLRATFKAFGRDMLSPILPRFLLLLATYGQVFLVQDMTSYVDNRSMPQERGWALVGGFVLIYTIIPVTTYLYWEAVFNVSVQYRSGLVGSIYAKTLRLASARKVGQGAATTYMSVDVERIVDSLSIIHEFWAAVISIVLACVLLWFQASYAMFAPLVTILLLLVATSFFSGPSGRAQTEWMAAIDQRIKLLSSMFSQILPIKLGAHEDIFLARATALRFKETVILRKFYLLISAATLSNVGSSFAGLTCICCYYILHESGVAGAEGDLTVSRIFTILTIVTLLGNPINTLGQSLPQVAAAFVSTKRLGGFLVLPEKQGTVSVAKGSDEQQAIATADKVELDQFSSDVPSVATDVRIESGTFAWERETPVLHAIDLHVQPGKLSILVGPVASGKSSLLSVLLGEAILLDGRVTLPVGKVAYASQTPFIFPGTMTSNILFDQPFDPARLNSVVRACGLDQDIARLPDGLLTKLGDKGVTLSGGQRQRVALARAVYSPADFVILDDTFSALDGQTEARVSQALFGTGGLLVGRTVILVTHGIHHLEHSDCVLVLDKGRLTYQGPYAGLPRDYAVKGADTDNLIRQATEEKREDREPEHTEQAEDAEEGDEEGETGSSNWRAYIFYFGSMGRATAIISFLLLIATNTAQVGIQGLLKAFASAEGQTPKWLGGYAGICFAYVTLQTFLLLHLSIYTIPGTSQVVHKSELDGVLRAPFSFLQMTPAGKLLNRFSQDIQQCDFEFPLAIINFVFGVFTLTGAAIFFILATPWLALSIPILSPIYWFIMKFYLKTSKQLQHLEAGSKSPLYTLFSTTVAGLTCIRSYKAERYFAKRNVTFLDRSQGPFFFRFEGQNFLRVVLSWMTTVLAIGMGIISVALRDKTSAAFLGVALSQLTSFGSSLSHMLTSYAAVENGAVSIKRIQEFVELPREEAASKTAALSLKRKPSDEAWPSRGAVQFEEYSMKYKEDLPDALKHLSFAVEGGQKVGICGRSGSGKSSMLLALFRATQRTSGTIKIDGTDVSEIPLHVLRSAMCIVTQDPFLWHGTIRANIDVESNCSDDQIWAALNDVGMKEAVSGLPLVLEQLVDDEDSFSKGQRQLLCLARALLSKRKIIVLDESTSSMDHVSDEKIRKVVETKMQDRTVLAIAHRISTIVRYDRILLLDHGEVMEYDIPEKLLADSSSRFARLAATQGIYAATQEIEDSQSM